MKIDNSKLELAMANACINTNELSQKASINCSTLTRIKNGKQVQPITVGKIAQALNVQVIEIIEELENQINK